MLDFHDEASTHEKAYTSFGQLPTNVDRERAPLRKAPFSTVSKHAPVHTVRCLSFWFLLLHCSAMLSDLAFRLI